MSVKTFLWIEDCQGKASYIFWENFMKQLNQGVVVESKKNNSELVKAVKSLVDTNNRYVIVFDNSFDNWWIPLPRVNLTTKISGKLWIMITT